MPPPKRQICALRKPRAPGHGPQDVVGVENVHVLVDQNDILELEIGGQGHKSGLAGTTVIYVGALGNLEDRKELTAPGGMGVDLGDQPWQGPVQGAQEGGLCGDAHQGGVLRWGRCRRRPLR